MKIIALEAENLKRLVAVNIKPNGALVEITGKNGQGKTSVLDAIWWALEGTSHIQAQPIRSGATEAHVRLDLGELKITRRFKAKEEGGFTTSIMVENADGARYSSPQAMLDALVGELSFDPLAFTRMKPKEQFDTLKRFVPDVDFDAIEEANKTDFQTRTDVNRDAKALRAQAAGIVLPADAKAERVDEAALVAEMEDAGRHNAELEARKARRADTARQAETASETAKRDRERAAELRAQADAMDQQADKQEAYAALLQKQLDDAPPLPEPIDTAAVRERIHGARLQNEVASRLERRQELERQAKDLEDRSAALTKAMADRSAAKEKAVAEAQMPVDGVGFGDGVVLLNGVPFDQGSDAEQLKASIAIAAAMNPKLRVIRVRDGSLLDSDSMGTLATFAEANDLQVWVETVASGRPGAVLIEDGHVKAAPALMAAE